MARSKYASRNIWSTSTVDYDDVIDKYGNLQLSKKQLMQYFKGKFSEFECRAKRYDKAVKFRQLQIADRNLEVVYICGQSGSGKTTLAKYYASKLNYDYFVSGSGDDFLDGYDKEECIILDDFRSGSMRFSEMLKFLDNNTNSSVKSRYNNKDISNCKLMFITTVYKPTELYNNIFKNEDGSTNQEPIEQFLRRIKHHYLEIRTVLPKNDIIEQHLVYEIKTESCDEKVVNSMDDIFEELGIDTEKVDDTSIMEGLFTYGKEKC